ncbi:hypothetical protein [Roseomonas sp. CECT 9278]|uniref:hypothetical protein n=1 Tax=Roseomonas sp. CECT 9278 TaxID=2845823 RepID=UPI001E3B57D9|nr:hypothetical protein [Roseomonas sp. CECT 9278]CAH0267007.1 hypothetical protein ROS9278_03552 [Roseomonas sp. CECT 9278]
MARGLTAIALALGSALLVQGCATRQGFEARMGRYVGQPEADLVASLGVPVRSFQAGNRSFLQYERRMVTADVLPGWGWGGGVSVQTWQCDTTFEIVEGRVVSFTSRGNDCVATPPR